MAELVGARVKQWVGRETTAHDILTPAVLARFRATIDSGEDGDPAPQGIHWCLCLPDVPTSGLGHDGHPLLGHDSFLPPLPLPRRMWASSQISFAAPIKSGDSVMRRSVIADITEKHGSSGALIFVTLDHETNANGQIAVTERQTLVYRAAPHLSDAAPPAAAVQAPTTSYLAELDLSAWQWRRSLCPDEAFLFRFSALTFNSHRIHFDRPYAVEQEGYRGLVVHGPLTATLLLDLVAREAGTDRLAHFAFRGMSPAFAGEQLYLVGNRKGDDIVLAALGSDGRDVMRAEARLAR